MQERELSESHMHRLDNAEEELRRHQAHAEETQHALKARLLATAAEADAVHASALRDATSELTLFRAKHAEELGRHVASADAMQAVLEERMRVEAEKHVTSAEEAQQALEARLLATAAETDAVHATALRYATSELTLFRAEHAEELRRHDTVAEEMQAALEARLRADEEKSAAAAAETHARAATNLAAAQDVHLSALESAAAELERVRAAHAQELAAYTTSTEQVQHELDAELLARAALEDSHTGAMSKLTAQHRSSTAAHVSELLKYSSSAEEEQQLLESKISEMIAEKEAAHAAALRDASSELERYQSAHTEALAQHELSAMEAQSELKERLRVEEEKGAFVHGQYRSSSEAEVRVKAELKSAREHEVAYATAREETAEHAAAALEEHRQLVIDMQTMLEEQVRVDATNAEALQTSETALGDAALDLERFRVAHAQELHEHRSDAEEQQKLLEAKLREEHTRELQEHRMKSDLLARLASKSDEAHAAELMEAVDEAAVKLANFQMEHAAELEHHERAAEEQEIAFEAELREKEKGALETLAEMREREVLLKAAHASVLAEASSTSASHRMIVTEMQAAHASVLAEVASETEQRRLDHDLQAEHASLMAEAATTAEQRHRILVAEMQAAHASELAEAATTTEYEIALAESAQEAIVTKAALEANEHQLLVTEMQEMLEEQVRIDEAKAKEIHETAVQNAASQLAKFQQDHAAELVEHRLGAEEEQSMLEEKLMSLVAERDTAYSAKLEAAAAELEFVRAEHLRELASHSSSAAEAREVQLEALAVAMENHISSAEETKEAHEAKLLALAAESTEKHVAALETATFELNVLRAAHKKELAEHRATAEAAQVILQEKLHALAAEEKAALHASALHNAAEELARFREEHAEELRRHVDSAEEVQAMLEAQLRAEEQLSAANASDLESAVAAHAAAVEDLAELRESHAIDLDEVRKREAALKDTLDTAQTTHRDALEQETAKMDASKAAHAQEIADHRAAAEKHARVLSDAAAARELLAKEHRLRLEEQQGNSSETISELKALLLAEEAKRLTSEGDHSAALEAHDATRTELDAAIDLIASNNSDLEAARKRDLSLKATFEATLDEVKASHTSLLGDAASELEGIRAAAAEELADHRVAAEEERQDLEDKLRALTFTSAEKQADLMSDAASELEGIRAAAAEELADHRVAAEEERQDLEDKLRALAADTEEQHAAALGEAVSELQGFRAAHAEELANHQAAAEEEQQRMESKLLALLKDTGEEHSHELTTAAAELEAIRDEHAVQLVQHHAAAEAAQASLKEKLLALAVEEKAALHASALSNAAEELARFREEHAEELQHHVGSAEEVQATLEAQLCAEEEANAANAAAHAAAAEVHATIDAELAAAHISHSDEIAATRARIAALEATHVNALDEAATQLEGCRTAHAQELHDHRATSEQEAQNLEARLMALMKDTDAKHATALSDAAAELERFRTEHANELERHQGSAEETHAALETQLRAEGAEHTAATESHAVALAELADARASHAAELSAANEHAASLRSAHSDAVSDAAAELESFRTAHADELLAQSAASKEEREAMKAKLVAHAAMEAARHVSASDASMAELKRLHTEDLGAHRATSEQEAEVLESKLMALLKDTDAEHATALSDAAAELERFRTEHANELERHQGSAEETHAALETQLRVEEQKCAAKAAEHTTAAEAHAAALAELAEARASHAAELSTANEHAVSLRSLHSDAVNDAATELESFRTAHAEELLAQCTVSKEESEAVLVALIKKNLTDSAGEAFDLYDETRSGSLTLRVFEGLFNDAEWFSILDSLDINSLGFIHRDVWVKGVVALTLIIGDGGDASDDDDAAAASHGDHDRDAVSYSPESMRLVLEQMVRDSALRIRAVETSLAVDRLSRIITVVATQIYETLQHGDGGVMSLSYSSHVFGQDALWQVLLVDLAVDRNGAHRISFD